MSAYKGRAAIGNIPVMCGLLKVTHLPTGSFFLVNSTDVRQAAIHAYNLIKTGAYHNPTLNTLTQCPETELSFTVTEYPDKEAARCAKQKMMTLYYQNPLLLNEQDWPKIIGAYKLTHLETGKFYVGATQDLVKHQSYHMVLLRTGKHKSPEFQKLWNHNPQREAIKWEWFICPTIEAAKNWADNNFHQNTDLCLNSNRFHRGSPKLGVYVLQHRQSKHVYFGSAAKVHDRVSHHFSTLRKQKHKNSILQTVFNEFGDDFEVTFHFCNDRNEAYTLEQRFLFEHRNDSGCVNIATNVKSSISSIVFTEEQKKRKRDGIRQWQLNNPDHYRKMVSKSNDARSKGIVYDGIEYRSLRKAWKSTGKNWDKLYKRLYDPADKAVYRINQPTV